MHTTHQPTRPWGYSIIAIVTATLLVSCAGPVMRGQFSSYNTAYANSLNEQMLLNLARLENAHPAYYLAIGTINERVSESVSAGAGTSASRADTTTTTTTRTASGGVLNIAGQAVSAVGSTVFGPSFSGNISRTSAPEFQYIPLNNEALAKQVLEPIHTDVFSTLYLQGYPIDQLMRVLIERIETTLPDKQEVVLINSPTRSTTDSFARYLRTCAILRELQRRGELLFDTRHDFPQVHGDANVNARTNSPVPTFYLFPERAAAILKDLKMQKTFDSVTLTNVIELLSAGLSIKTEVGNHGQARTRLVLRSFDRAMEAVAGEEKPMALLLKNEAFTRQVPDVEQRPIIQLQWPDKNAKLEPPVQKLSYNGKTYQITDPIGNPLDATSRWNRDVFRLMVALGSQVTVDISKFQRQVLQLQ